MYTLQVKTYLRIIAKVAIWLDLTVSGREFTYNIGPRIEPCGNPDVIGTERDVASNDSFPKRL